MTTYFFDDRNIAWHVLDGIDHLAYSILHVDEQLHLIDVLFKFAAQRQIVLHRHMALNVTFVIQGEHRLFAPDGQLKEVRPVGRYTMTPPSIEPHREGGGDVDAVVLFSIRGNDGILYEILDDGLMAVATLSFQDFVGLYRQQVCREKETVGGNR